MKHRPVPTLVLSAITVLLVVAGSTAAWAACPASPNFTPDFGVNQECLTLNGEHTLPAFVSTHPTPTTTATVLRLTPNTAFQAGSAWFNTAQPVANGFSTTFTFQLTGANQFLCGETPCPADGIAFVIQNSALTALGPDGCGIGFGGSSTGCTPATGIPQSLAVEFDTYQNDDDPNNNHVAIQSCLTSANTRDPGCRIADNSTLPVIMADGNVHTVTITYTPPTLSGCGEGGVGPCSGRLHVILDNNELFPTGVAFDLTSIGLASGGNAFVGFTAATGGADDNQDILSWRLALQAQSAAVTAGGGTATLAFQGGVANNAYDYNAALQTVTGGVTSATVQVKPIVIDEEACENLVRKSFPFTTQCFVYQNAADLGIDSAVMFEVTCPDQPGGTCGSQDTQNFFAELGTNFTYTEAENPGFKFPGTFGIFNPFPGWLKGAGPDPLRPCTPNLNNSPALFQSNQIDFFNVVGDPGGTTKGKSGGGGSCWVATYLTWGELPPGIKITSPKFTTYNRNQLVTASYTCSNPVTSKPAGNPTGPYLTVASCTQSQAPNPSNKTQTPGCIPGQVCTGGVDTSVKGLHAFQVTAKDSGGNVNVNVVVYNVK